MWFPIVDLRYVFKRFKAEKMPSMVCESKKKTYNLSYFTYKEASISSHLGLFLTMVLITIVSLSLSVNKRGNHITCDTNLLMPMSSLLI